MLGIKLNHVSKRGYCMEYAVMKIISCYFISCTVMFEKCKNLVYMNEYGTECKNNISAYGFWPSQLYDTLSMNFYWKALHKTRCIYFSEPPRLKLQWSYLHGVQGIIPVHLFGRLSFKSDVNQNIYHWKCVTFFNVTVHTQAQQSYVTVHSLLRYGSHMHF